MGFFSKLGNGMRRFMAGRYGPDKLNTALLLINLVICILSMLIKNDVACYLLTLTSFFLMGLVLFRMLSRNTYKRYQENRRYLRFLERLKDRDHRHFDCPRCHQPVRVPRKKGKIAITCPKWREKFIRKT